MVEPGRGGKGRVGRRGEGGFDNHDGMGGFKGQPQVQQFSHQGGYPQDAAGPNVGSGWKPNLINSRLEPSGGRADQDGSWRNTGLNGHSRRDFGDEKGGGRGQEASRQEWQRGAGGPGSGQNGAFRSDRNGGGYAPRYEDQGGPRQFDRADDWRDGPKPGRSEPGAGKGPQGDFGRKGGAGGKGSFQDFDRDRGAGPGKGGAVGGKGWQEGPDRGHVDRNGYGGGRGYEEDIDRSRGDGKGHRGGKGYREDADGRGDWKGGGRGYEEEPDRSRGDGKGRRKGKGPPEEADRGRDDRWGREDAEGSRGGGKAGGKGGKSRQEDFDRKGGKGKQEDDRRGGKGKQDDLDWGRDDRKGGKGKQEDDRKGGKGKQEDDRSRPDRDGAAGGKGSRRRGGGGGGGGNEGGPGAAGAAAEEPEGTGGGRRGRQRGGEKGGGKAARGGKGGAHDDGAEDDEPVARRQKGQGGAAQQQHGQAPDAAAAEPAGRSGGTGAVSGKHLSTMKFSSLEVSQQLKTALAKGFGYELMTEVQAATIGPMLAGQDVLARAKTGTGKTLAFLVPMVERIHQHPSGVGGLISALVLSPTRELAQQIADEGKVLLEYQKKLGISVFYGGTNIGGDQRDLANRPIDILVATPGRMQDHLDNTQGFRRRLEHLKLLVLDEADQLLDMGFRDAILKILRALPPPGQRQGALFSATFPAAVGEISKLALRPDHALLNTVRADDEVTPDQIDQCVSVTTLEGMTELLWAAVNFEMKRLPRDHKIMVFFTTARLTQLYAALFTQARVEVLEIHSRKSQAHRTKCTENFRNSQSGVIFSSDVCARGLDYPNVTAVIQVGIPSSRDQYIHRLGRTGRAGKSGRCILLLHDFERFFLNQLKDLPVKQVTTSAFPGVRAAPDALWQLPDPKSGGQAYQAWLGYYNSVKGLGWPKDQLVREANRFAESIGALGSDGLPPPILKKTVGMMGLRGVPGLNIVSALPYGD